jgi:hypothetical protein
MRTILSAPDLGEHRVKLAESKNPISEGSEYSYVRQYQSFVWAGGPGGGFFSTIQAMTGAGA